MTQDSIHWQHTGKLNEIIKQETEVILLFDEGLLRVKVISTNCFRVTFTFKDRFLNIPSFAVVNSSMSKDFFMVEKDDSIILSTEELKMIIFRANGKIVISDLQDNTISQDVDSGFMWTKDWVKCKKKMNVSDHFYGLGEKTGFLDKRGRKYVMWNTDDPLHTPTKDPLYKSIPFLICFNKGISYGIFVDKTCKTLFNLGEESEDYFSFEVEDFEMDYYFIYGPDMKRVIGTYTELTGRIELPPLWGLGYQQSRWSYYPEETVRNLADSFRKKDIPCDVIYLDIDYMDGYRVFTWDSNRFPEPERMLKDLRERGFKVVTIVDPGVKKDSEYEVYLEGIRKGLFCKYPTGEVYHGKVWPGISAFPDFTKEETRKWWGEKHRELLGKGVSGIWNDMNEPSDFSQDTKDDRTLITVPNDVIMENDGYPRSFAKYHNIYGLCMCKATYEGFKTIKPEERPFILTRSCYAGIQRYAAVWTGDNHSWWEHLASSMPMFMNIGLSGVPFVGGDVGGFQDNATPELFARWIQLGAFTPFFRGHSCINTKPHEPWAFGKEVEDICRKYIKLRYRLIPYIYNEFYKANQTGLPVMRPLVLDYPDDENVYNLSDQFLFGESIMVAPVYRPSTYKRMVYIPEGIWYNWWTEEKYEGRKYILVDAPLEVLPLFVKEGAIIPMGPEMNYIGEKPIETLTLEIYVGKDSMYSLYQDDGTTNKYKTGEYLIINFEVRMEEDKLVINIDPIKKDYLPCINRYLIRLHGLRKQGFKIENPDVISCQRNNEILEIAMKNTWKKQTVVIE